MIHTPETVIVHGKTYEYKPYSAVNIARLKDEGTALSEKLNDREITEFEYYDQLLRLVLKRPDTPAGYEWDVQADDFNAREAEQVIVGFLPPSKQAFVMLSGWESV